jgi:hypothetical protein
LDENLLLTNIVGEDWVVTHLLLVLTRFSGYNTIFDGNLSTKIGWNPGGQLSVLITLVDMENLCNVYHSFVREFLFCLKPRVMLRRIFINRDHEFLHSLSGDGFILPETNCVHNTVLMDIVKHFIFDESIPPVSDHLILFKVLVKRYFLKLNTLRLFEPDPVEIVGWSELLSRSNRWLIDQSNLRKVSISRKSDIGFPVEKVRSNPFLIKYEEVFSFFIFTTGNMILDGPLDIYVHLFLAFLRE